MNPDKPEECGRCSCRTINLAKSLQQSKPDLQVYEKCEPPCPRPIAPPLEMPLPPGCMRICDKDTQLRDQCGRKIPKVKVPAPHGKLMYLIKACVLGGTVYFTHQQGLWDDQQTATRCLARWRAYIVALPSGIRPKFDKNGNPLPDEGPPESGWGSQLYSAYKAVVTSCFTGVVELPKIASCSYEAYIKQKALKRDEERSRAKS